MKFYNILLLLALMIITSCSNVSTSELIDVPFVETVTYTDDIKPIIDNNCLGCHLNPPVFGAPMHLTTYENVKEYVQNGKIIDRISRNPSDSQLMPYGGPKLPQPIIDLIIKWRDQGCQE